MAHKDQCDPDRKVHHESMRKRGLLKDIGKLVKRLDCLPVCDQWDTIIGEKNLKNIPEKGPYRFGIYRPKGKPWSCGRVKSTELIGSKLISHCKCLRKNGLQDQCDRTLCKGKPWCLYEPFPKCPPFTNVPKVYYQPDPYEMCEDRPWERSPEYPAYNAMKCRAQMRFNEGCFPDNKKTSEYTLNDVHCNM